MSATAPMHCSRSVEPRRSHTTIGELVERLCLNGSRLQTAVQSGRLKCREIAGELFVTAVGLREFARGR